MVSDGQESIRKAVAKALDGVPHQLCHFHYLREAAKPISEADRHAKKELKKRVRGIRPIEGRAEKEAEEGEDDAAAEVVRGYCAAVRARLDRRWAAAAGGRRAEVARSAEPDRRQLGPCGVPGGRLARGFESAAAVAAARAGGDGRPVAGGAEAYKWVQRVARILKNEEGLPTKKVRRRLVQLLGRMRRAATTTGEPSVRAGLKQFLKVTRSYWPGLFRCYDTADLPRTNNDLEHTFGSHRYHERRSSGRRRASPGLVVMGSARVISGLATRLRPEEGLVLRPGYVEGWQELRAKLEGGASAAEAAALPP